MLVTELSDMCLKEMLADGDTGFRVLFNFATISIVVVDSDGKIKLANPCAEVLLYI
ncbi:hypothetical protein [Dyadobacter psychrotolerans]|uniref:hypothetical protein n=1 Tax=Dyadobacter psychrotolerans TaxID=2541721 RepID=UPI00140454B7|nr:hypothetical protein [Dyadobacter psychrotolerans]